MVSTERLSRTQMHTARHVRLMQVANAKNKAQSEQSESTQVRHEQSKRQMESHDGVSTGHREHKRQSHLALWAGSSRTVVAEQSIRRAVQQHE